MNQPFEPYNNTDSFVVDLKKMIDEKDPYIWDDQITDFIRKALQNAYMNYWT